jgi:hypothetical protein
VTLVVRGSEVFNVFGLSGTDENSATYALGWALEKSVNLRQLFVHEILGGPQEPEEWVITLQRHSEDGGYTDLEAWVGDKWHFLLEAKRGWDIPTKHQLSRYSTRLIATGATLQRLVTLSAADRSFAASHLPNKISEVPVTHLSWTDILRLSRQAQALASGTGERLWMRQFAEHLQEYVWMDRTTDNRVYVVSLGTQPMVTGEDHTWIDVVEKDQCYFHPVGNHWPVQPPNYVGFRYYGRLQSVHHIDGYSVVRDLATVNDRWPTTSEDHFVYRLGPAMRPPMEMRAGTVLRNRRVSCAIDTLLSGRYATLSDATEETKRRLAKAAGS